MSMTLTISIELLDEETTLDEGDASSAWAWTGCHHDEGDAEIWYSTSFQCCSVMQCRTRSSVRTPEALEMGRWLHSLGYARYYLGTSKFSMASWLVEKQAMRF